MHEKEKIQLDAELLEMVDSAAFRAILSNGHEIIAHFGPKKAGQDQIGFKPGRLACVEMSPYDMSVGRIIGFGDDKDES